MGQVICLTRVLAMLMLLVQGPHVENHVSERLQFIWAEGQKPSPLDKAVSQPDHRASANAASPNTFNFFSQTQDEWHPGMFHLNAEEVMGPELFL